MSVHLFTVRGSIWEEKGHVKTVLFKVSAN